jgi:hypothetical protein
MQLTSAWGQQHALPRRSSNGRFTSMSRHLPRALVGRISATSRPEQVQQNEQELLDHLVGGGEQRGWHRETEHPGCWKINHQLELT